MKKDNPKNYDVIIAFVVFLCCLFFALFFNLHNEVVVAVSTN